MSTSKLTQATKDGLIGRRIHDVGENYIVLDNGLRIYLEDSEIEHLNDINDDE